ncbi:hypothetical protein Anapl_18503 [Anas platyrhynchos]|uniref:Uncharacterized protein n=1 Tax=Anas platyrhynchos TaxID=8839 RepID=R0KV82_ANAPL|nr:hypothetical protein Anapl_18503 [Anas platyrhynchos]
MGRARDNRLKRGTEIFLLAQQGANPNPHNTTTFTSEFYQKKALQKVEKSLTADHTICGHNLANSTMVPSYTGNHLRTKHEPQPDRLRLDRRRLRLDGHFWYFQDGLSPLIVMPKGTAIRVEMFNVIEVRTPVDQLGGHLTTIINRGEPAASRGVLQPQALAISHQNYHSGLEAPCKQPTGTFHTAAGRAREEGIQSSLGRGTPHLEAGGSWKQAAKFKMIFARYPLEAGLYAAISGCFLIKFVLFWSFGKYNILQVTNTVLGNYVTVRRLSYKIKRKLQHSSECDHEKDLPGFNQPTSCQLLQLEMNDGWLHSSALFRALAYKKEEHSADPTNHPSGEPQHLPIRQEFEGQLSIN